MTQPDQTPIIESEETTKFFNDKPSETSIRDNPTLPTPSLDDATLKEARTHEIRNFLARPILLSTLTWNVGHTANTSLGSFNNPSALFTQPQVRTKIAGFLGFKGTMVLTVQLNASRFQQGLLLINYLPLPGLISDNRAAVTASNLIFRTQLPHTTYDVSTDTEVSLAVPYTHIQPFTEIFRSEILGTFNIVVYSPLITVTGDTSVSVNVWAHLEDVELEFPGMMISQSGRPVRRTQKGKTTTGGASVSDRELSGAGVGSVSSVFGKISGAASVLSSIPTLSGIAGPAAWLTSILGNAAAAAGWSNPSQSAPIAKMMPARMAFSSNVNGVDNSIRLAAFSDNEVEVLPGFGGTDDDELSISRIVQRPAYWKRVTWDTTSTGGLVSIPIRPISFTQDVSLTATGGVINNFDLNTPLSYVAKMFTYWRGSICIKIRLVKTEFHTGRLLAAWSPGDYYAPLTIAETTSLYREVYDIADSNEINICIPFVHPRPWMRNDAANYGSIVIFVLNSLRCPATVSNSIDLVMEVSGGDDIRFAVPASIENSVPCHVVMAAQSGGVTQKDIDRFMDEEYPRPMISQGLGVKELSSQEPADMAMMPSGFGSCSMGNGDLSPERFCMGEAILSLRQLLKRSVHFLTLNGTAESSLDPFMMYTPYYTATGQSTSAYSVDYYSALGNMFVMSRGGIRLKLYQPASVGDITVRGRIYTDAAKSFDLTTSATQVTSNAMLESIIPVKLSMSGAVEVEIPQYTCSYARPNWYSAGANPTLSGKTAASTLYASALRPVFTFSDTTSRTVYLRQGADDTDFGCFIGVLPTVRNYGLQVPPRTLV